MKFKLTKEMRLALRKADVFGDLTEQDFCESLQNSLQESHLKTPKNDSAPMKEVRKDLHDIAEQSRRLALSLGRLDSHMLGRLNELIGFDITASQSASEPIRWRQVNVRRVVASLAKHSARIDGEWGELYGTRSSDKAIHDLIDFWTVDLGREFSKAAIVKMLSAISGKTEKSGKEAVRKLVEEFLERVSRGEKAKK